MTTAPSLAALLAPAPASTAPTGLAAWAWLLVAVPALSRAPG